MGESTIKQMNSTPDQSYTCMTWTAVNVVQRKGWMMLHRWGTERKISHLLPRLEHDVIHPMELPPERRGVRPLGIHVGILRILVQFLFKGERGHSPLNQRVRWGNEGGVIPSSLPVFYNRKPSWLFVRLDWPLVLWLAPPAPSETENETRPCWGKISDTDKIKLRKQNPPPTFWSLQTILVFSFFPTKSANFLPRTNSFPAHQRAALSSSITSCDAWN